MKIWKTKYADQLFSNFIRARDKHCMRCKRTDRPLDCSHYWERGRKGTRFDPKNCVALCRECHTHWEKKQNHEYMAFMIEWLGLEKYGALELRARTSKQMWDAVVEAMSWLKGLSTREEINY